MTQRDPLMELRGWMVAQEERPDYLPVVFGITARTPQRSRSFLAGLLPRAPIVANRRVWTIALVGLLLAALLGTLLVAGRILQDRNITTRTVLASDKPLQLSPAEISTIVRSAYAKMSEVPPLVLTARVDGTSFRRISVGQSGDVRVDELASADAADPTSYRLYAGGSIGELLRIDGEPFWYLPGTIAEDPRVFVYAAMQGTAFGNLPSTSCPGGTDPADLFDGSAWTAVGIETVIGRPTYHLHCTGDLWIDQETALVLKSEGPRYGLDGFPLPGRTTIEATSLEFRTPPAALFTLAAPAGVPTATDEQYNLATCRQSGRCLATPRAPVRPAAAPAEPPSETADELVALARASGTTLPGYEVVVKNADTGLALVSGRTRVLFDGTGRYRIEMTLQPGTVWESTMITLAGDGYRYVGEPQPDGSIAWRSSSRGSGGYPLSVPDTCQGGWGLAGVDLIAGRVADQVACQDRGSATEIWIDRKLRVVLRSQESSDPISGGISIDEVEMFGPGVTDASLFNLPAGASVPPG
jgi:hypothetical protein